MLGPGTDELAGKVLERHQPLGPGLEISDLGLPLGKLIPENHCEVRTVAPCSLHLAAEFPVAEVCPGSQAGCPESRRHAESGHRVDGVDGDHDRIRRLLVNP